ncbi:MAG: hypothetical protein ACLQL8_06310 [Thermoplasmata archaeon]
MNVQAKPPVVSVVMIAPANVPSEHPPGDWRTELNKTVACEDTLNPDPVTTYVAPTGPWAGLTTTVGVVTRNAAVALS